jgi:hypothetical protein
VFSSGFWCKMCEWYRGFQLNILHWHCWGFRSLTAFCDLTWNCKQNGKLYFLAFFEIRKQNLMRIEMCMEIQQLCCGLNMLVTFRIRLKVILGGVFASWLLQTNSTSCAVVQK